MAKTRSTPSKKPSLAALMASVRGSASLSGPVPLEGAYWDRQAHTVTFEKDGERVEVKTGAGTGDTVSIWIWGDEVYVLCARRGIPYVGLEHFAFFPNEGEWTKMGDVFFQGDAADEALGEDGFGQSGAEMVRRLVNYL